MATPRKGTVVDERYRLERKIGSGGMADVWLADDTELEPRGRDQDPPRPLRPGQGVRRALPPRGAVGGRACSTRTWSRSSTAASSRTPTSSPWSTWTGPSSSSSSRAGWGSKDAIDFTRQILNAARFAHRKGIVHRDLKPQNVLIDDEGRARVADFGIARGESSDITGTGSVMGTAQYLSPEQAQGKETTRRVGHLLDRGDPLRGADRAASPSRATAPSRSP